jgi:peptide deformylase
MAILHVLTFPNPILRQKAGLVTHISKNTERLVADMMDTMKSYKGIGLAAPQVGILERIIIVGYKRRKFALINPVIKDRKEEQESEEGCLSLPNILVRVKRAKKIIVEALTLDNQSITLVESGMVATIIQHEIDHLNGVLITDYGPPIQNEE